MWPWRRFEIVTVDEGGASCETVAAIVMILRLYKVPVAHAELGATSTGIFIDFTHAPRQLAPARWVKR